VHHRNGKERVRRVRKTSQHVIPRNESSDNTKRAARYGQSVMRVSVGGVAGIKIRGPEADESNPDREEERAES
jgi:hypothetical protein